MKHFSIQTLCMIALFTAVISILAQFSVPLPFGVPLSLQNFAVALAAILLGRKYGTISILVYLLIGFIGIPVFANFRSGPGVFISPTGGFLLGYPIMTYLIGFGTEHRHRKGIYPICFLLGLLADYAAGLILFCLVTSMDLSTGIITCILPFLPADCIKGILVSILGIKLRKQLLPEHTYHK